MKTKPTIPEVIPLVSEYYSIPGNAIGGSLHIVLEDGNTKDCDIEFCKRKAAENNDARGVSLADILLRMSRTQRKKLCAMDRG